MSVIPHTNSKNDDQEMLRCKQEQMQLYTRNTVDNLSKAGQLLGEVESYLRAKHHWTDTSSRGGRPRHAPNASKVAFENAYDQWCLGALGPMYRRVRTGLTNMYKVVQPFIKTLPQTQQDALSSVALASKKSIARMASIISHAKKSEHPFIAEKLVQLSTGGTTATTKIGVSHLNEINKSIDTKQDIRIQSLQPVSVNHSSSTTSVKRSHREIIVNREDMDVAAKRFKYEHYSPSWLVKLLRVFWRKHALDIDLCSSEEANTVIKATRFYSIDTPCMSQPHWGVSDANGLLIRPSRIYLNGHWKQYNVIMDRLMEEWNNGSICEMVVLTPYLPRSKWAKRTKLLAFFDSVCCVDKDMCFERPKELADFQVTTTHTFSDGAQGTVTNDLGNYTSSVQNGARLELLIGYKGSRIEEFKRVFQEAGTLFATFTTI